MCFLVTYKILVFKVEELYLGAKNSGIYDNKCCRERKLIVAKSKDFLFFAVFLITSFNDALVCP
jgi:hypothetical protein